MSEPRFVTHAQMITRLTAPQRDMLISHIDGPVVFNRSDDWKARGALIARKLLRADNPHAERPKFTILTESGREALARILGEYADGLARAGLLDQERPIEVLHRLKALAKPGKAPVQPMQALLKPNP